MGKVKRVDLKKARSVKGTWLRQCYRCGVVFNSFSKRSRVVCDNCNLRLKSKSLNSTSDSQILGGN